MMHKPPAMSGKCPTPPHPLEAGLDDFGLTRFRHASSKTL
jgi:hypothetical protein